VAESAFSLLWRIKEFVSVSTRNSDSHIQAIEAVDLITSNSQRWLFLKLLCMCVYLESMLFWCRSLHFLYLEYQTLASVPLRFQTQIFNLESHWSDLHLMDLLFLELLFLCMMKSVVPCCDVGETLGETSRGGDTYHEACTVHGALQSPQRRFCWKCTWPVVVMLCHTWGALQRSP